MLVNTINISQWRIQMEPRAWPPIERKNSSYSCVALTDLLRGNLGKISYFNLTLQIKRFCGFNAKKSLAY